MKKKLFILLTMIMVLSLMSIPALAGPPDGNVWGRWCYGNIVYGDPKISGGENFFNVFQDLDDDGAWFGTFEGYSSDDGRIIAHPSGYTLLKSNVSFEGTVLGKTGSLEMRVNGWLPVGGELSEYEGTWVITRATDGLEGLVGQGTWGGVELWNDDCLAIEGGPFIASVPLKGNIHFEND